METRHAEFDSFLASFVELSGAFNNKAPKGVKLAVVAPEAQIDAEYAKFAKIDLSNMGW